MTLIMMVVAAALVGILAQKWKRRTGALWGAMSFVLMIPIWFFLYLVSFAAQPDLYHKDEGWYALGIVVSCGVGIIMALLVATLPKRKNLE